MKRIFNPRPINLLIVFCTSVVKRIFQIIYTAFAKPRFGKVGEGFRMGFPNQIFHYHNVFIGNNVYISKKCVFLCTIGKIHIKDNAMIGEKTSLYAGNHNINESGKFLNKSFTKLPIHDKGITIGEDTIMTANVTVLDGVTIGRGAVVGAGAVVRTSIPPYAIVAGNPAMVIGFRYTPAQVVTHEEKLYKEEDRIPLEELQKNFKKYYLQRLAKIASVLRP